jgi:signal transduction histidine kinase/ActR/RegA family two-component response regulator
VRRGPGQLTTRGALTGAVLLLLAGVVISAFNEHSYQTRRAQALTAQAEVLARTVSPALVFEDPAAAAELVGALEGNAQIGAAGVYDARGGLVARFVRAGVVVPSGSAPAEASARDRAVSVAVAVIHEGRRIGIVSLRSVREPAMAFVVRHSGIALLLVMAVLMVAAAQVAVRSQTRAARESRDKATELAELNTALQKQIERRETAEEALRQAQKMETLGQLTGGIAHDFNNLLQSVQGSLDMIVRHPDDATRVARWARAGLEAAQRGARLTAQLLAFSRSQKLEMRSVNVREMMGRLRELIPGALGAGVRVRFVEPEDLWVVADAVQLELAVLNLCINARDAMPNGGDIEISASPEEVAPGDPDLAAGGYLHLAVSDNGVGMPTDVRARAFEPFFTTKGVGKGTGLGLAQVYGIARQAGGVARIESGSGVGTTVSLYLPLAASGAAVTGGDALAPIRPGVPRLRVLVIDDDPGVRSYVCDALASLGYDCIEAADGPSGLALLDQEPVDLLLIDYAMPGMSGADVAVEAQARRPDLPILFASGYAETDALDAALGRPVQMLRKPFDTATLAAGLEEALAGRWSSGTETAELDA